MKKIVLAVSLALVFAGAAQADDVTQGAVKEMVAAYKKGKSKGMLEEENVCWSAFKPRTEEAEGGLGYCGMIGFIGHLIEEGAAKKEGRKMNAYWSQDAVVERFVKNAQRLKISEKKTEEIMELAYVSDAEDIALALVKAGYQ